ncbi:MAG: methyltransferase [Candidatus Altiarchaeota archaeon]|nr:methyltransferase [Candidatus Altiarchaeota archaeon]
MIYYRNLRMKTHPEVYEPAEDSFLLAENLCVGDGWRVLDMGTGTGLLALVAAENAEYVLGVDVNPVAVGLALENAVLNGVTNVGFKVSDLFSGIRERFDLIVFNPPYLPVDEDDTLGMAWSGGLDGLSVVKRFIGSAPKYLSRDGVMMLLVSSFNDVDHVRDLLEENGLGSEVVSRRRFFFEELFVLRCSISAI